MKNMTTTVVGVGIVALMGLATAQGTLLFEADANNDLDPNDGWDYTGTMADGPATLAVNTTLIGALERFTQGTQAYFHRTADDRFFNGTLEVSASVADWSLELWVRKDVTGEAGVPEDQVFNIRDASFTEFITVSGQGSAAPIDEPDFDHRDFNGGGARSQLNNAFTWPDDTWQQWVATYQDSEAGLDNGVLTIFVDGVQVAQNSSQKPRNEGLTTFDTMGLFVVVPDDWNRGLSGDLAIVRFYDNILTQGEIDTSFATTALALGIPEPGSLALLACGAGILALVRRRNH